MRILIVARYFPPLQTVAARRPWSWARSWTEAGHEITVLTPGHGGSRPQHGFRRIEVPTPIPAGRERPRAGPGTVGGLPGVRPREPGGPIGAILRWRKRTGVLSGVRMPDLTDLWVRPAAARILRSGERFDATVSTAGPYTTHLVAARIRRAGRAVRWLADFRDPWTEHHMFSGMFPFTLIERRLERRVMAEADVVTTVTRPWAERMAARFGRPVEVVENGYEPEERAALSPEPVFPADGVFRLVYTGTIYAGHQDIEPVLAALRRVRDAAAGGESPPIELVVAGLVRGLDALARAHGVADLVRYVGTVPRETALRMQRDASALLLLEADPACIPAKLFEYLAAGPPVLVTGASPGAESRRIVEEAAAGRVAGSDPEEVRTALAALAAGAGARRSSRPAGAWSRVELAARMLELLRAGSPAGASLA